MGREIKRVPVDFDWPLEQIWAGYVSPYTPVKCRACDGTGDSVEYKKLSDEWERISPPDGEGWQVWETVSEGSPVTPVFSTGEELVEYLVENGDLWCQRSSEIVLPSREATSKFVFGSGWVPSAISTGNGFKTNIHCAEDFEDSEND